MHNSKWIIAVLFMGCLSAQAVTTDLPPAPSTQIKSATSLLPGGGPIESADTTMDEGRDFTLRRLESIQAETVIVEAQVIRAKALKLLEESGNTSVPESFSGTAAVSVNTTSAASPTPTTSRRLPQINEIYGAGNRLIARLALNDGSYTELTEGQHIPGTQLKVAGISAREVKVSGLDGGNVQSLPFN
jgi:type IV pilus biogenesis protein PilP